MKVAISNIAWNKEEDDVILKLLKKYSISGIEIAPTKIWKNPTIEPAKSIKEYRKFWEKDGIRIVAAQAILFGRPDLAIFENSNKRKETLLYIEKMIKVSAALGARIMVFGSPKNRDRGDMRTAKALDIAEEFFYKIGEIAKSYGIFFCIEPNPKEYGTNFINNTNEALELINLVSHPYFKLHLDSGVLTVNKEDYKTAITQGFPFLKHFHVSEKNLLPIGKNGTDHKKVAKILKGLKYDKWVSIEMRGVDNRANHKIVSEALEYALAIYS